MATAVDTTPTATARYELGTTAKVMLILGVGENKKLTDIALRDINPSDKSADYIKAIMLESHITRLVRNVEQPTAIENTLATISNNIQALSVLTRNITDNDTINYIQGFANKFSKLQETASQRLAERAALRAEAKRLKENKIKIFASILKGTSATDTKQKFAELLNQADALTQQIERLRNAEQNVQYDLEKLSRETQHTRQRVEVQEEDRRLGLR